MKYSGIFQLTKGNVKLPDKASIILNKSQREYGVDSHRNDNNRNIFFVKAGIIADRLCIDNCKFI